MSLNGNLILKPYLKTKELRTTEVAAGFVMTANKIGVEPLELLVDTNITLGQNTSVLLKKGSRVYFKEETLHTQKWPRNIFESEQFPEGFVVGSVSDVLFIEAAQEKKLEDNEIEKILRGHEDRISV
jgi:hypothetical protein